MLTEIKKAMALKDILKVTKMKALSCENKEFYEDATEARTGDQYSNPREYLLAELKQSADYNHTLFMGHLSSGKSTELNLFMEDARDDGFFVCKGSVDEELDILSATYVDILFLILKQLIAEAKEREICFNDKLLNNLRQYWETITEKSSADATSATLGVEAGAGISTPGLLGTVLDLFARVQSTLNTGVETRTEMRRKIEPDINIFVDQINDCIHEIMTKAQKAGDVTQRIPIIVIDDTEKMIDPVARDLFYTHGNVFKGIRAHLVFAFPIQLSYSPDFASIQNTFSQPFKLPMIKTHHRNGLPCDEGIKAIKKIIYKRIDERLFEEGVCCYVIEKTGGYLRDVFGAIGNACIRAQLRNSKTISIEDVQIVLNRMKASYSGTLSEDMLKKAQEIAKGDYEPITNPALMDLLRSVLVLEYNGERWCDLHPLLKEYLVDTNRIS